MLNARNTVMLFLTKNSMFQVASTIQKVATRADNTLSLAVNTQELTPEETTELFKLKGKLGWFMFKENEFTEADIPEAEAPGAKDPDQPSPSERLRNVLFVFWKLNKIKGDFQTFYNAWIDKKVEDIKANLPKEEYKEE